MKATVLSFPELNKTSDAQIYASGKMGYPNSILWAETSKEITLPGSGQLWDLIVNIREPDPNPSKVLKDLEAYNGLANFGVILNWSDRNRLHKPWHSFLSLL